jgi:hypothetical protein
MIHILKERWADSFKDEMISDDATFEIFENPDSREWKIIRNQAMRYEIPVRFSFVSPADVLYVGAVPFHASLTDQARKDHGSKQRGRVNGVVNVIDATYEMDYSAHTGESALEAFYSTVFYRRVLSQLTHTKDVPIMAGEIN